jgi:hypothetical protein
LSDRIEALARDVVEREARHAAAVADAHATAERLHEIVDSAIDRFNAVVRESVPYLEVHVTPVRTDDKHLHAVEFDLERGRHRAVVTAKSKGEVTLVGPFRSGKNEGPCRSFPFEPQQELEAALAEFLERFLEEAAAP